ncbi:hypothetical protein LAPL110952_13330 [Lactiplantibacillus plajomi]
MSVKPLTLLGLGVLWWYKMNIKKTHVSFDSLATSNA